MKKRKEKEERNKDISYFQIRDIHQKERVMIQEIPKIF
jgi:hypothetical protein